MRSSFPAGPTICRPTGIPFGPVNAGTVRQGPRISVQTRLKAEFETETRSATASPQVLGVMIASQRSNISASARWHARECACALLVLRLLGRVGSAKRLLEPMVHGREMMPRLPVHRAQALDLHDDVEGLLDAGEHIGQFGIHDLRSGRGQYAGGRFNGIDRFGLGLAPAHGPANPDPNAVRGLAALPAHPRPAPSATTRCPRRCGQTIPWCRWWDANAGCRHGRSRSSSPCNRPRRKTPPAGWSIRRSVSRPRAAP